MAGPGDNTQFRFRTGGGAGASALTIGRRLARVLPFVCFAGLFAACGTTWHPEGSSFAAVKTGYDLKDDWKQLKLNYGEDGNAIASELVNRGATCVSRTVPDDGDKVVSFRCVYFFCVGSALQQLNWGFLERPAVSRNWLDHEPGYINYSFARSGQCRNRGMLRSDQRDFALANGGEEFLVRRTVN